MSQNLALDLQWFGDNHDDGAGGAGSTNPGKGSDRDWKDDLPDDLKAADTLGKFKGPTGHHALAKSYVELERKMGEAIVAPKEGAKPEEWEKFHSRAGRPESADKYRFDPVVGFDTDKSFEAWFRQEAFASGLSPHQANREYAAYGKRAVEAAKASRAALEAETQAADASLREAWGKNYDHNVELSDRFIDRVGGEGTAEHLRQKGYNRDPVLMTLFANAGELTGAHKFVPGSRGSLPAQKNPYSYMDEKR